MCPSAFCSLPYVKSAFFVGLFSVGLLFIRPYDSDPSGSAIASAVFDNNIGCSPSGPGDTRIDTAPTRLVKTFIVYINTCAVLYHASCHAV